MAKDPDSALIDGMPDSVIRYNHPKEIGNPSQLADRLIAHCKIEKL